MSYASNIWNFTYDANGMRTSRSNAGTTYTYTYNGSQLSRMYSSGGGTMRFTYSADGTPQAISYGSSWYYYATNLQGDVIAILDNSGNPVVYYYYDAWGKLLNTTGSMASTLGLHNPLRYRGYVYDRETGLYYLQSRYYNPTIGRWINADSILNKQSVLGSNMFAYCLNNPVNMADETGELPFLLVTAAVGAVFGAIAGGIVAAATGGDILSGIGIGAAAGGLIGTGVGAAAGFMLAGSVMATTTAVASGAGMFATAVSTGGLGAGAALIADNVSRAMNNVGTVLYSGGEQAFGQALNYANNSGGTVLSSTQIGQIASSASQLPYADSQAIWSQASATFCHQASGVVNAFVSNGTYRGVDSIFWGIEMPALLSNPRVTEIIIHIFE